MFLVPVSIQMALWTILSHDRIGADARAEPGMPVLLRVLGAEHRRAGVVAAFKQFQQHGAHVVVGMVQEPFIDHEQRERGILPQELRVALVNIRSAGGHPYRGWEPPSRGGC